MNNKDKLWWMGQLIAPMCGFMVGLEFKSFGIGFTIAYAIAVLVDIRAGVSK